MKSSYLAIDPGETLGWASFDAEGNCIEMGQNRWETFAKDYETLLHSDLKQVIVEQYVNYGHKQQKRWSDNKTSKIIGKIELLAELRNVPVTLQPANVYPTGAAWGGFEIPSNHSISHQFVAVAHGIYWLQKNGIRPVGKALLDQRTAGEERDN